MTRCGTCKGRGEAKPTGLGLPTTCPTCGGTGDKPQAKPKPKPKPRADYQSKPDYCFLEGRVPGRDCYGAKTWHHIVSKRAIIDKVTGNRGVTPENARILKDALSDPRVLIGACWGCHLGTLETDNPRARVTEDDLPEGFWAYVDQYDLANDLPRHLRDKHPRPRPIDRGSQMVSAVTGRSAGGPGPGEKAA